VQYVTTAPSPKTRYQLRQLDDKWELEAQAVVTNDSEEDWRTPDGQGVHVSVVTGEPIDLDTDLAEISRPRRQKLNLSRSQALGAVVAEEELPDAIEIGAQPQAQARMASPRRMIPSGATLCSGALAGEIGPAGRCLQCLQFRRNQPPAAVPCGLGRGLAASGTPFSPDSAAGAGDAA
jgi:hypothetical protein